MSPQHHLLLFSAVFFSGIVLVLVNAFRARSQVRRAREETGVEPLPLDTRIPMDKTKRLAIALFFLFCGVYGFVFVQLGTGFKIGVAVLGGLGAAILVLIALGKAASGWLLVSAGGLKFGDSSGNSLFVPWDRIKSWRIQAITMNAAVFITLNDTELDARMIGESSEKFIAKIKIAFERNFKGLNAHVIIQTGVYEASPASIVATMKRYAPDAAPATD